MDERIPQRAKRICALRQSGTFIFCFHYSFEFNDKYTIIAHLVFKLVLFSMRVACGRRRRRKPKKKRIPRSNPKGRQIAQRRNPRKLSAATSTSAAKASHG